MVIIGGNILQLPRSTRWIFKMYLTKLFNVDLNAQAKHTVQRGAAFEVRRGAARRCGT